MAYEKVVRARLMGVTSQNSDYRNIIGDTVSGATTVTPHPMRGSRFWDRAQFILTKVAVAGGATGGSYTVTLQTDAIAGTTGLPVASASGIGPNSNSVIVLTNSHSAPCAPIPTHIFIDQTATGGAITFDLHCIAKQYRGAGKGARSAERVYEGVLFNSENNLSTNNLNGSATITLTAGGASANFGGLDKMDLWDNCLYWAVAGETCPSGYDATIIGPVGGVTFAIASTGSGSALGNDVSGQKVAIASNVAGCSPKPSAILWTENSAGDGISSAQIVFVAKSGRGSNVTRG